MWEKQRKREQGMPDETIYKRGDKGKKVAKQLKTRHAKIRFKDRAIDIKRMITVGRDPNSDIVIKDDPLVSRRHALIEREDNIYYITDKGSTNGTYVNNNPIPKCERYRLKKGDMIQVGKTKLTVF
jgi:pSer/pThr/pTyr-binding forkhead associated (FHA) protein